MKKWKKTLILFLCALIISNVIITDYKRVEVKAEPVSVTVVTVGGMIVLTLGGLATYQILANGGVVDKETFTRYYNANKAMFERNAVDYINRKGYEFKTLRADSDLVVYAIQQGVLDNAENAWQKIYGGGTLPPVRGIEEPWTDINLGNPAEEIQKMIDEYNKQSFQTQTPDENPNQNEDDGEDYQNAWRNRLKKFAVAFGLTFVLALGAATANEYINTSTGQIEKTCSYDCNEGTVIFKSHQSRSGREFEITDTASLNYPSYDKVAIYDSTSSSNTVISLNYIYKSPINNTCYTKSISSYRNTFKDGVQIEFDKFNNVTGCILTEFRELISDFPYFTNYDDAKKYIDGEIGIEEAENYIEPIDDVVDTIKDANKESVDKVNDAIKSVNSIIDTGIDNVDDCITKSVLDIVDDWQKQKEETPIEDVVPKDEEMPQPIEKVIPWDIIKDVMSPAISVPVPVPPVTPITPDTPIIPDTPTEEDGQMGGVIGNVFPFCIPFDLIYLVKSLKAEPVPPKWIIPFKYERLGIDEEIVIDFAQFEPVAEVCRVCFTILFILMLIMISRKLIKG